MLLPDGHQYSRDELEHLKRSEIQKLCKDYGLRANMKTEILVDELLETIRSNIAPLVPPPQPPQTGPVTRRASTRSRTSSRSTTIRTRGSSGSSYGASEATDTLVGTTEGTMSGTESFASQNATGSRVRKAKDSQLRLGVGRPAAVGGSGARAVTRSNSKARRNRISRSVKLVGETIEEEQDAEQPVATTSEAPVDPALLYPQIVNPEPPQPSPQASTVQHQDNDIQNRLTNLEALVQSAEIPQHFEALRNLANEFGWLKQMVQTQYMELNSMKADMQSCRQELQTMRTETNKVTFLENQIAALKEAVIFRRVSYVGSVPGTPGLKGTNTRRVSIPLGESNINASPQRPGTASRPSDENVAPVTPPPSRPTPIPPSTLGKRPRDSTSSELADALHDNTDPDKDLSRRVLRPNKKRAKLSGSDDSNNNSETANSETNAEENANDAASVTSGPSTVPPIGTPPPSTHLPDFFVDAAGDSQQGIVGIEGVGNRTGEFGAEGFYPFTFGANASSTPRGEAFSAFGADFTLGSAMKSPAQRGPSGTGLAPAAFTMRRVSSLAARPRTPARLTGQERFKSMVANQSTPSNNGTDAPQQQQHQQQQVPQQTVEFPHADSFNFQIDDAYGIDFPSNRDTPTTVPNPMSMNLHFGIGFGFPADDGGSSPIQNPQKTMYGTELANDTRFGDFGRDGVASMSGKNMYWWNQ